MTPEQKLSAAELVDRNNPDSALLMSADAFLGSSAMASSSCGEVRLSVSAPAEGVRHADDSSSAPAGEVREGPSAIIGRKLGPKINPNRQRFSVGFSTDFC